ncbi:hypothetical protein E2562_027746 [Oryza meyeriana var. granulata]|uniref:Uncharacterized protein n=1 Tax=Oryza meyeriana var. granulata TaxID=110450 RepID=A0A6G1EQP0_9ORYZ|nr:hypothetical protein E2562_027746 [Oryza meyeriana var. granulata]
MDAEEHPKLASIAMDLSREMNGCLMGLGIYSALLKNRWEKGMHGTGLALEEAESSGNEHVLHETLKTESCRSWRASRAGSSWLRGVEFVAPSQRGNPLPFDLPDMRFDTKHPAWSYN